MGAGIARFALICLDARLWAKARLGGARGLLYWILRRNIAPSCVHAFNRKTMTAHKHELEEGSEFAPRFDANGLIVCVTIHATTREVLMVAYLNALALEKTLETGIAHYWSRSRKALWRKGDTSGQTQKVVELRVDCDQDALVMAVLPGGDGGACHTGRKTCFYRRVENGRLVFV
jgi:phosphoribosyl-AMP cyclohydrolase